MTCCNKELSIRYACKTVRISEYQNGLCLSAASFVPRVGDTIRLAVYSSNIGPDPTKKFKVVCVSPSLPRYYENSDSGVFICIDVEEQND